MIRRIRSSVIVCMLFLLMTGFYNPVKSQEIRMTGFSGLEPLLYQNNDTTYVINFWATWCLPCIRELPHFQQLHEQYSGEKLRVVLVSLDFKKDVETRLKPFVLKNKLTAQVLLLYDPDGNTWIDKVSPDWSGALPATLIYNNRFRKFYEKGFTYDELHDIIKSNLINK